MKTLFARESRGEMFVTIAMEMKVNINRSALAMN